MSTRSGEFVELSELVNDVGIDSTRYYFLARKAEQALEFDIDLAKKTDKDNHVYYIQYAHARICSLLKENKKRGQTNFYAILFTFEQTFSPRSELAFICITRFSL